MDGKIRKKETELNTGVGSYSELWPERRFSLNESRDVQCEMWEFEMFYSPEPYQTIAKVVRE